jgi:hypothetical protein
LSYKKGKPFRGVAIAKSRLLSSSTVSPLLVSPSASFGQPATSPSPLLLRPRRASYLAVFVDNLQKKPKKTERRTPAPSSTMAQFMEMFESYHWTLAAMYLCIVGGVCCHTLKFPILGCE